jgi:hypothetical protein
MKRLTRGRDVRLFGEHIEVERGTIGDHAEPSGKGDLRSDLFYRGSTPISG